MRSTRSFYRNTVAEAVLALLVAANARGQGSSPAPPPAPGREREVDIMLLRGGGPARIPFTLPLTPDMGMDFMSMPIGVAGKTILGAPYSAEAVTDVVQTLADGNRIVRESRTTVYRAAAGRTRREGRLPMIGPIAGGAEDRLQVQITDPEKGVSYILDMEARRAHKTPIPRIRIAQGAASTGSGVSFEAPLLPPPPGGAHGQVLFRRVMGSSLVPVVEQLGTQSIEGVTAEGTRSTMTIPAGAIGNEQPINVVSERWYSPRLKVLVLSRQNDPRYGETTYRLTNIIQGEPSSDLFQVPQDFTVGEPGTHGDVIFQRMVK